jgi:hypothetical protein
MVGTDVPMAFVALAASPPELEIRINFGVFAGREATPAELDLLGRAVMTEVEHVTLVSEHRHELGSGSETSLHQVRMGIPLAALPEDTAEAKWTRDRIVTLAECWAQDCIDERHADVVEFFPA